MAPAPTADAGDNGRAAPARAASMLPYDTGALLRELHHRVKNNLQIIASLMNLRKRALPEEHPSDIRFIEEHVQSMSVAYRLGYASDAIVNVPLSDLIAEVLSGLRHIAGLCGERVLLELPSTPAWLGLDRAVALALYLAVLLPPFLDHAAATTGCVTVTVAIAGPVATLSVRGNWNEPLAFDDLRGRLKHAHATQLGGEIHAIEAAEEEVRFSLA